MNDFLQLALQAAEAARQKVLEIYMSGDLIITTKHDGSPVTKADLRANTAIQLHLSASGLPLLSEEAIIPFEERCSWDQFWLIDPLDGTKDFIAHNDEFTINIALIERGTPTLGVVVAPALGKVWFASVGEGAWEDKNGIKRRIDAHSPWPDKPRMFTSRFHDVPTSIEFGKLNGVGHYVPAGAASKLARLAASEAEFYPRFAGTSRSWRNVTHDYRGIALL
jgi:3'(2'), 5'-bisphosphate nucleotidase